MHIFLKLHFFFYTCFHFFKVQVYFNTFLAKKIQQNVKCLFGKNYFSYLFSLFQSTSILLYTFSKKIFSKTLGCKYILGILIGLVFWLRKYIYVISIILFLWWKIINRSHGCKYTIELHKILHIDFLSFFFIFIQFLRVIIIDMNPPAAIFLIIW